MKTVITILTVVLSLQAWAVDKSGNYAIWGKGHKSCFRYLKERSAGEDQDYRVYLMGYLTAYNAVTPETYSISRDMNLDEILSWVDNYCDSNGMHSLEQSLMEFIISHYEQRFETPPGRRGR